MTATSAKAFTSLLVSILSFLGWSVSDYAKYLPENIQSQILLAPAPAEFVATSTPAKIAEQIPTKAKSKAPTKIAPKAPSQISKSAPAPIKIPTPIIQASASPSVPTQISTSTAPAINQNLSTIDKIKSSTVNILCSMIRGNQIAKYTGSGVIIDPSGIILTNAHVAEHVMLSEAGHESCDIRTGSPAHNSYKAKVIFLPDAWINANKNNLSIQNVTGTGENDYALLIITERTRASAPNVPLVYLAPDFFTPSVGNQITLAGYPAGFGSVALLDSALYLLAEPSSIKTIASFDGSTNSVLDTAPTALAEHGSSGGAIVGEGGSLIGIIDSEIIDNSTGQKAVQGIMLSYIQNAIEQNSGKSLNYFLSNPLSEANTFASTKAQSLSAILMSGF